MLNLSVVLEDAAREQPERDAVVFGDLRLSYAGVDAVANQVANLLASRGIGPGDKVALCCPNLPYFPMVYYGVLKAGAVVVPLNMLLQSWEITYHLDDCDARAFFCFEGTPDLPLGERGFTAFQRAVACEHFITLPAPASQDAGDQNPGGQDVGGQYGETLWTALAGLPGTFDTVATEPTETAVILYGSGTSGRLALGAELSHANMVLNALVTDSMFPRAEHDVYLAALPLFHSFGQTVCMNTGFLRRATLVLLPRFAPDTALALMERHRITFFAGVPTMYWAMLEHPDLGALDVKRMAADLSIAVSGGAALPGAVLRDFADRFGVDVLEGYGLSETSPVAAFNRVDRPAKAGSIGLPIWGVEMKLIDPNWADIEGPGPGEIAIRGHNVMKGYYNRPDETAEVLRDGWLRTGDIARRDAEGHYFIVDRSRDLIIRDGVRVYPRDVEEVLISHPEVSLAAVAGVPDDALGEEIKAYVVRSRGATITGETLLSWCAAELPDAWRPRLVEFRDRLPMTATGKILKREL
ncbi:long-chain fatty acid--CoA ligase [Actinomadura fulvescens]|uniref:Long-chain fatty acid--CoA ligase n=1 Tax=Actinomadura fulvescens TaxID=46160 RepID=A0ABN3Q2G2_9ACTN